MKITRIRRQPDERPMGFDDSISQDETWLVAGVSTGKAWARAMRRGLLAGDLATRRFYQSLLLDGHLIEAAVQVHRAAAATEHANWYCALPAWKRLAVLARDGARRKKRWWEL